MDAWTRSLLTNGEILGLLDKDCRGTQIVRNNEEAVWKNRNRKTGALHVALFNLGEKMREISINVRDLGEGLEENASFELYELWDKTV